MERSTVKTVLLVVGSGIGGILLFVVAVYGYFIYKIYSNEGLPEVSFGRRPGEPRERVSVPPEIKERFLGTQGSYSGHFPTDRDRVLATGPGAISGSVTAGGKPVKGLRLRLALNGSVMSEWAETDAAGRYSVSVPYGKYRIDGYNLDYEVVDSVLGGKTDSPANHEYRSEKILNVAEGTRTRGPDFHYVDPVRKKGPQGEVSLSKRVVLEWEPYPTAAAYAVQLTEAADPRDYRSRRQLFECCRGHKVSETSYDLSVHGIELKKGYSYFFEITAFDARGKALADSAGKQMTPDFVVTD